MNRKQSVDILIRLDGKTMSDRASIARDIARSLIRYAYDRRGNVSIEELEKVLHYSRRHLSRCFRRFTGIDLRSFLCYVRFQDVLNKMDLGCFRELSEASNYGGYYDQAHFQRHFKRFSGMTPGEYMCVLENRNYQDLLTMV